MSQRATYFMYGKTLLQIITRMLWRRACFRLMYEKSGFPTRKLNSKQWVFIIWNSYQEVNAKHSINHHELWINFWVCVHKPTQNQWPSFIFWHGYITTNLEQNTELYREILENTVKGFTLKYFMSIKKAKILGLSLPWY